MGRRKILKTIYQRISCLHDNSEATGWRVFASVKEPTNEKDKNAVVLVGIILTVKMRWLAMCNRNLHDDIHVSIPAPLRLGHLYN